MSSDTVIRVESLSKQYRLGLVGTGTLSHDLNRWWCRVRGKPDPTLKVTESNDRSHRGHSEYVWALRDINFEVKRGEVLGIIGRNGAGKSTLLKILSRVTAPTEGQIKIKGRLAALLEVGTGFHPELTGRENIYLNGAILGMTKAEITRKLDEIVDFSGCERYIDTPVKRYSSGMMVRLGFAVAAHLEPEILIVDEVLAVGDAEFQKKCLGKMQDVAAGGRTVLFVSHSMPSISTLCPRSVLLVNGRVGDDGPSGDVIVSYLSSASHAEAGAARSDVGDDVCQFISAAVLDRDGRPAHDIDIGSPVTVSMVYRVTQVLEGARLVPNFHFYTTGGACAFVTNCPDMQPNCSPGTYSAECRVPAHLLNEGVLAVGVAVTSFKGDNYRIHFDKRQTLTFNVRDSKTPDEYSYGYVGPIPGVVRPRLSWEVTRVE